MHGRHAWIAREVRLPRIMRQCLIYYEIFALIRNWTDFKCEGRTDVVDEIFVSWGQSAVWPLREEQRFHSSLWKTFFIFSLPPSFPLPSFPPSAQPRLNHDYFLKHVAPISNRSGGFSFPVVLQQFPQHAPATWNFLFALHHSTIIVFIFDATPWCVWSGGSVKETRSRTFGLLSAAARSAHCFCAS